MIKINLLPARKPRRTAEPGASALYIGLGAFGAAALAVFFLVDRPMRAERETLDEANARLNTEIATKSAQLKGYAELQKSIEEADKRAKSIDRLLAAKVVPANVLHELGEVLTPGHQPTMTVKMAQRTGNGTTSDPNRRFSLDWDPQHVWLTSFVDKDGTFKLDGGAQADDDVTQLAKRLQASVYFTDVSPQGGERVVDAASGLSYYQFTITGKVAY
jgi:Tfp pilus assembly protein PilN